MKGIPKGAGQCSVFPVAINTDGSAATQGRQQGKIFFVPVWREKTPVVRNHVKSKSEAEDSLSPAGGKSKSSVKLPAGVTMTLGDATCHSVPESGNLSRSSPFAECAPPSGIYCVQHTWKKKKVKGSKCVKPCYWAFSCCFPGFSVAAGTFKKLLIQKMNTVEKGNPKFMSQTHTCCRWQMLCCRANEFFSPFLWG